MFSRIILNVSLNYNLFKNNYSRMIFINEHFKLCNISFSIVNNIVNCTHANSKINSKDRNNPENGKRKRNNSEDSDTKR